MCLLRTLVEVSAAGWVPSKLSLSLSQAWRMRRCHSGLPFSFNNSQSGNQIHTFHRQIRNRVLFSMLFCWQTRLQSLCHCVNSLCQLSASAGWGDFDYQPVSCYPPTTWLQPRAPECVGFLRNESYLPIEGLLSATHWNITESAYLAFFLTTQRFFFSLLRALEQCPHSSGTIVFYMRLNKCPFMPR